ncbi:MAG: D-alanine--D-alanine ligase [Myxococcales bacterium]|nr:D-alanine--D-alanine ligase [Myxococcales bacterium]
MSGPRVLVLAGGRSDEHDVSLLSARSIVDALRDDNIPVQVQIISRRGEWLSPEASQVYASEGFPANLFASQAWFHLMPSSPPAFDVVFPVLHGPYGEDGRVQGLLEMSGVAYVGTNVISSALCMDKLVSKTLLTSAQVPQVNYAAVTHQQFCSSADQALDICMSLQAPWFVKPANLGSSVGISRATTRAELEDSIRKALQYDFRVIVEEAIHSPREFEMALIGNDEPEVSVVGEITYSSQWYDYDAKYTQGRSQMHIPADVPLALSERMRDIAARAYKALQCEGLARVDFLYEPDTQRLVLNELNTMPGFTAFSMFGALWEHSGLTYKDLIKRLIEFALERRSA